MQTYHGARPVDAGHGRLILHLSSVLDDKGMWRYTYSIAPGVTVTLSVRAGAGTLPADDPVIVAEVQRIMEAADGYTGADH